MDPHDMHRHAAEQSCCSGRVAAAERGIHVIYRAALARWELTVLGAPGSGALCLLGITHCPWCGASLDTESLCDPT